MTEAPSVARGGLPLKTAAALESRGSRHNTAISRRATNPWKVPRGFVIDQAFPALYFTSFP